MLPPQRLKLVKRYWTTPRNAWPHFGNKLPAWMFPLG
jgi:hypothetical protein